MSARFSKINLLPKDSFDYSPLGKFLKWSLTTGRALVVLTEFVVILAFGSRFYYDRRLNDLLEVTDQKQAVIESYREIEAQARDFLTKQKIVEKYLSTNIKFDERLNQIKRITPIDVTYTKISVTEREVSLTGKSGSEESLASLVANIGKIPDMKGVTIGGVDFDQKQGVINFKLSANTGKKI